MTVVERVPDERLDTLPVLLRTWAVPFLNERSMPFAHGLVQDAANACDELKAVRSLQAAMAQVKAMGYGEPKDLEGKIRRALNCHSRENESHTPDFILSNYLLNCLQSFEAATRTRDGWHGFKPWNNDTYCSPTGEATAATPPVAHLSGEVS